MADDARLQVEISAKIDKLIDGLNKAGTKIDAFSRSAYAAADRVRKGFDIDQSRIDGPLKVIELQNKLTVAQVAGNKAEAAAIKEQIGLLTQVNALRRQGLTQTEAQAVAEKQVALVKAAEAISHRVETAPNIGLATERIFDSARLATLEEGGARLRIFGSALEPLGPAGLAAAAGVAALAYTVERGRKVAEWAEDLEKASRTLGLTTTQLQEFDFVAQATGIDVQKNREALSGLERSIGAVADGSARARQLAIFTQGLKISPEDLRGWGTLEQQFPHILDAFAKLNVEARADFASKLKIDPEVLQSWIDQRDRVRDLIAEANKLGIVLDEAGVAKMAAAGEEMRKTSAIIHGELNVALADIAPALVGGAKLIADTARDLGLIERGAVRAATAIRDFIGWVDQAVPALGWLDRFAVKAIGGLSGLWSTINHIINPLSIVVDLLKQLGALPKGPAAVSREDMNRLLHPDPSLSPLINGGGGGRHGGRGARGPSGEDLDAASRTADEDVDNARKALAEALRAATNDLLERHNLEETAINAEADAQATKLKTDYDKAASSKKISQVDGIILAAKYDEAQDAQEAARQAKLRANDQKLITQTDAEALALQRQVGADLSEEARIRAALLTTAGARNKIETADLLARQQLDRRSLDNEQRQALNGVTDPGRIADITGGFNQRRTALLGLQSAQRDQLADNQLGPIARFAKDASSQDYGTDLQANAVQAVKTLNDGLAEAIVNGKSLNDVLKNVFKKFLSDFLNQGLQGLEGNLLKGLGAASGGGSGGIGSIFAAALHFIPFFASGTDSAPGGPSVVGEHGPEVVNLRRGTQVISNQALRAASAASNVRSSASGPRVVQVSIAYDMSGTSGDDAINRKIAVAQQQGNAQVFDQVRRAMPGWQVQGSYERG